MSWSLAYRTLKAKYTGCLGIYHIENLPGICESSLPPSLSLSVSISIFIYLSSFSVVAKHAKDMISFRTLISVDTHTIYSLYRGMRGLSVWFRNRGVLGLVALRSMISLLFSRQGFPGADWSAGAAILNRRIPADFLGIMFAGFPRLEHGPAAKSSGDSARFTQK